MWVQKDRVPLSGGLAGHKAGQGVPVLLVHGVGLRAEAWNAQIADLSRDYCVHAIDLPGHGASLPVDAPDPALEDFSNAVAAGLTDLGEPAHLVGHSLGALIALDCAVRHPDLCRSVTAVNALYRRTPAARKAVRERARALAAEPGADPGPTLQRWFGDSPAGPLAACAEACREWLTTVPHAGYAAAYAVFARDDGPSDGDLRALSCPALFVTGEGDPNSTPAMSRAMARLVPAGRAEGVPGAAHMLPMTHPAALYPLLRAQFSRTSNSKEG